MTQDSQWIEVRVERRSTEADDICSFELVSARGEPLQAFDAGAHVDVQIPGLAGVERQYSLCNAPGERHRYVIAVQKDAQTRGGSLAMHERLHPGSSLRIGPPRNLFALAPNAGHSLLLAGGIGVTPLLAMAEKLASDGAPFALHYSCRTAGRMAFRDRLLSSPYADAVHLHLDDGPPAQRLDLEALLKSPRDDAHVYICGPLGFLHACMNAARSFGWQESQIHFESFSGQAAGSAEDTAFDVRLAHNGQVINVAATQSVVQALAEQGIEIPMSCEQGICGTCVTRVVEGEPDHRDMYFTPAEHAANRQFTPCCSRSKTPVLVIDIQ